MSVRFIESALPKLGLSLRAGRLAAAALAPASAAKGSG